MSASALPTASAATSTRNATTTPNASRWPNPTAGPGTYTSVVLAYSITIPGGWHRSACVSGWVAGDQASEVFFRGDAADESGTDTGFVQDTVTVRIEPANGLTPLQWLESGKMGYFGGSHFERTTFDGKDAAATVTNDTGKTFAYVVTARDRMYALSRGLRQPTTATETEADTFMTSFHILSDAELADARATLATPSPAPTRSAEDVADALAKGFAAKDTSVLASVAAPCLNHGIEQAGGSFGATAPILADMQRSFANGLSVTVEARPLVDQTADYAALRGMWKDPNGPQNNVTMMIRKRNGAWQWTGWIDMQPAR